MQRLTCSISRHEPIIYYRWELQKIGSKEESSNSLALMSASCSSATWGASATSFWYLVAKSSCSDQSERINLPVSEVLGEEFRPILKQIRQKPRKSKAGRKPIDVVLMFKLLILQKLYNISDEQLEYQVNDRLSFMQFLGLSLSDAVPDGTTVWLFRQQLTEAGLVEVLFEKFESYLQMSEICQAARATCIQDKIIGKIGRNLL